MSRYNYQRLSALDTSFLAMEDDNAYMHVAGVSIFELGPLRTEHGGVDFEAIERLTQGLLSRIPRYRQKLHWIPYQNHPVWVDDPSFYLHYHLRHTSLPRPGTIRQLKRLAARVISQPLDRAKPLWETWVVEGLEGDRFATITKAHHCMIDGVSGVDLGNIMMSDRPDRTEIPEAHAYVPRSQPSRGELLFDEVLRRASLPIEALRRLRGSAAQEREAEPGSVPTSGALRETLGWALQRPTRTPLNAPIGPHRRFDWTTMELDALKEIGKSFGGSVNDVVLTIVAGAVRRFFRFRGVEPDSVPFRILAPVSVRDDSERGTLGNRVSAWMLDLPIAEAEPRERFARIAQRTTRLKRENQAAGGDSLMQASEWLPGALFALAVRTASHALPFNMVVTNVPGIQRPGYTLGAKLLESYGVVPLVGNLGLGVAVGSYDGRVFWGFNADWELVPDLHDFVQAVETSFEDLRQAAGVGPPPGPSATTH